MRKGATNVLARFTSLGSQLISLRSEDTDPRMARKLAAAAAALDAAAAPRESRRNGWLDFFSSIKSLSSVCPRKAFL